MENNNMQNRVYSAEDASVSQACENQLNAVSVATPSSTSHLLKRNPTKTELESRRAASRNVIAVITEVNDEGLYKLVDLTLQYQQPNFLLRNLNPVLDCLIRQPEALAFREPVDPVKLKIPDYFDIVKNPIDLSTIRSKLLSGRYTSGWEFIEDVWLMFDNAWLYNKKTTRVYKDCLVLSSLFKRMIDAPMKDLGYCCGQYYLFHPKVLFCVSKKDCIIPKFKFYWNYKDRYNLCKTCYDEILGDFVIIRNSSEDISIKKEEFVMKYNNAVKKEPLIKCLRCGIQHHKICNYFLEQIWKEGFLCRQCCIGLKVRRVPNPFRAKNLTRSKLDSHIEERVNSLLRKNKGYEYEVIIRLVHNGRKSVSVKESAKSRFVKAGIWPEQFPYSAKVLMAFQQVGSFDVCFFSMYVQEYDSSCPQPNSGCIYISYLDSVNFFQPKELRTQVYHEILLGYLDFVKNLGYRKVYIWACPPKEGEDFVFYCHPSDQKIPYVAKLVDWYKTMLDKAVSEGIVIDYKDIYTKAIEDKLQNVSELPYFDGDFLPTTLEQEILKIKVEKDVTSVSKTEAILSFSDVKKNDAKHKKRQSPNTRKGKKHLRSAKNIACYTVGDPLTNKILSFLQYYKEGFLVVQLNYSTDIPEVPTDVDPEISSGLMCLRESFLEFSKENDLEFCTFRRAQYSTLLLLFELHRENMDYIFCNLCKKNLRAGYHCNVCKDFDLCSDCYHSIGHGHEMEVIKVSLPEKSYEFFSYMKAYVMRICKRLLQHQSECKKALECVECKKSKDWLKQFSKLLSNSSSKQKRQPENGRKSEVQQETVISSVCSNFTGTDIVQKNEREKVMPQLLSSPGEVTPLARNAEFVNDIGDPHKDSYYDSASFTKVQERPVASKENCGMNYHGLEMPSKDESFLHNGTNSYKMVLNSSNASAIAVSPNSLPGYSSPTSKSLSYLYKIPMNKISSANFNSNFSSPALADKSCTNAYVNLPSTTSSTLEVPSSVQCTSSGNLPKFETLKIKNISAYSDISGFTPKSQDVGNDIVRKKKEGSSENLINKQALSSCQTKDVQPTHSRAMTSSWFDVVTQTKNIQAKLNEKQLKTPCLSIVRLKSGFALVRSKSENRMKLNDVNLNKTNDVKKNPNIIAYETPFFPVSSSLNTGNPSNYDNSLIEVNRHKPDNKQSFNSETCNQNVLNDTYTTHGLLENTTLYPSPKAVEQQELKNDVTSNANTYFSISNKSDCPTGFSSSRQQTVSMDTSMMSYALTDNNFSVSSVSSEDKYSSQIHGGHSNSNGAQVQQVNFFKHVPVISHTSDSLTYRPQFTCSDNEINKHVKDTIRKRINQNSNSCNHSVEYSSQDGSQSKVIAPVNFEALSQNSKEHVIIPRSNFGTAEIQTINPTLHRFVQNRNGYHVPHHSQTETPGNVNNQPFLFQLSSSAPVSEASYMPPTHSFPASDSVTKNSNTDFCSTVDSAMAPVKDYINVNVCSANSSERTSSGNWSMYNLSSTVTQNQSYSSEPYNNVLNKIESGNSYDTNQTLLQNDPHSVYPTNSSPDRKKIVTSCPSTYSSNMASSSLVAGKFVQQGDYVVPTFVSNPISSISSGNFPPDWQSPVNSQSLQSPYTDSSSKNIYVCDNVNIIPEKSTQYQSFPSATQSTFGTALSDKVLYANLSDSGSVVAQNKIGAPVQLNVCLLQEPVVSNWHISPTNYYPSAGAYSNGSLVQGNKLMKLRTELKKRPIVKQIPCSKRGR